jgi:hypothetical protein
MKVIFLDIDGVLNSAQYIRRDDVDFDNPQCQIDPDAVVRLNTITETTGASIVVSSTWRLLFPLPQLQTCLAAYKINALVFDKTGVQDKRKFEIQEWLDCHSGIESYVIIDDETIEGFHGHTVKTIFEDGLQDHHIQQAIAILGYK